MSFDFISQLFSIFIVLFLSSAQYLTTENTQNDNENDFFCKCMDYWECFSTGGQLFTYCPYSNEVCCMTNQTLSNEKSLAINERKSAVCGKKEFDSGIQEYAEPGEWSWHTAIMIAKDLYVCGGSLIDENWVLTAAHCVHNIDIEELKVRVGEYDVLNTNEAEKHQEIKVNKLFIHPNFNSNTLVNDIAILLLSNPVKKSPNINIVCLPNKQIFSKENLFNSKCFITGWGKTSEGGNYSPVLKEVVVPLWNHSDCQQSLRAHFGSDYNLSKTAICGGDVGHDACDGDGGGGLFCEYNQFWYQIGIISFGVGCGRQNSPGVYTNVLSFLDWILEITSKQFNSLNRN